MFSKQFFVTVSGRLHFTQSSAIEAYCWRMHECRHVDMRQISQWKRYLPLSSLKALIIDIISRDHWVQ